ncbi:MAG TPA: aminotransferase class III-fold pyridoxal phosphate-dependent enzyme [Gemmatimonadales bacterium]|jgi:glutamate-1-semialdehyde 2,1-aminomutase
MTVAGVTSTGSKRPASLFGSNADGVPLTMESAHGATVIAGGRPYLDFIMGLGAVALGYGDPDVTAAVHDAAARGVVGPLPPADEAALAQEIAAVMPQMSSVRFLKTGAEAMAAAVRLARVHTGRDQVLGCGYHGWLDWCSDASGVPVNTRAQYGTIPFNDLATAVDQIHRHGTQLACVVIEPVIEAAPSVEWLNAVREATHAAGALLIFDEVKTGFRIALGGAVARWGVTPDLTVIGKALANGFPLAAVGGSPEIMAAVDHTWISSTAATEFVALAAARATIRVMVRSAVAEHLARVGQQLYAGLERLAHDHRLAVRGIPEMCYLACDNESRGAAIATASAQRGLLFKRSAYNFVSLAHDADAVDHALTTLAEVLRKC